jgi:hypothetical protein
MALATIVPAEMKWAQACGIYILLASMHLLISASQDHD